MGFYSKILDRAFCIFPITLGRVDPQQDLTIKTSQIEAFRNTLFSSKKFWRVPEKIGKNEGGQIFFNLFPCQKMKFFVLFSMMWLYPVLFSINSRLQKM